MLQHKIKSNESDHLFLITGGPSVGKHSSLGLQKLNKIDLYIYHKSNSYEEVIKSGGMAPWPLSSYTYARYNKVLAI